MFNNIVLALTVAIKVLLVTLAFFSIFGFFYQIGIASELEQVEYTEAYEASEPLETSSISELYALIDGYIEQQNEEKEQQYGMHYSVVLALGAVVGSVAGLSFVSSWKLGV